MHQGNEVVKMFKKVHHNVIKFSSISYLYIMLGQMHLMYSILMCPSKLKSSFRNVDRIWAPPVHVLDFSSSLFSRWSFVLKIGKADAT